MIDRQVYVLDITAHSRKITKRYASLDEDAARRELWDFVNGLSKGSAVRLIVGSTNGPALTPDWEQLAWNHDVQIEGTPEGVRSWAEALRKFVRRPDRG